MENTTLKEHKRQKQIGTLIKYILFIELQITGTVLKNYPKLLEKKKIEQVGYLLRIEILSREP